VIKKAAVKEALLSALVPGSLPEPAILARLIILDHPELPELLEKVSLVKSSG
jgi:hypothetical protein